MLRTHTQPRLSTPGPTNSTSPVHPPTAYFFFLGWGGGGGGCGGWMGGADSYIFFFSPQNPQRPHVADRWRRLETGGEKQPV